MVVFTCMKFSFQMGRRGLEGIPAARRAEGAAARGGRCISYPQPGLVEGFGTCLGVTLCQEYRELRTYTRMRCEQASQLPPLLIDGPPPA